LLARLVSSMKWTSTPSAALSFI